MADEIYRVDTVPPPADTAANDAPTKVGPVTAEAWLALMRESNKRAEPAQPSTPSAAATRKVGKTDLPTLLAQVEQKLRATEPASDPPELAPSSTPISPPSPPQLDPALVSSVANVDPLPTPSAANEAPPSAPVTSPSPSEKDVQTRRPIDARPSALRAILLFVFLLSLIALAGAMRLGWIVLRFR